jgi:hypothetical protein
MKQTLILTLSLFAFTFCNAQKLLTVNDINLTEFEKLKTPVQLLNIKFNASNEVVLYSQQFVSGKFEANDPNVKKKDSGFEVFSGKSGKSGVSFVSELVLDANHIDKFVPQKSRPDNLSIIKSKTGELLLPEPKKGDLKYIFEPSFFSDMTVKKGEIKTDVDEYAKKKGIAFNIKRFTEGKIVGIGSGFLRDKNPKTRLDLTYVTYYPDKNSGLIFTSNPKTESPNKDALESKLPYMTSSEHQLILNDNVYQSIGVEKVEGDKWYGYRNFRLVTIDSAGKLLNTEDMTMKYIRSVNTRLPIFQPDGKHWGSMTIFGKQLAFGNKDLKDPVDGNRNLFFTDINGKLWSKFDYQHAKGAGFSPFNIIAATMKNDKILAINMNTIKLTKSVFEYMTMDKDGKVEVTGTITDEDSKNATYIGNPKSRSFNWGDYYTGFTDSKGNYFLIGQNVVRTQATVQTPASTLYQDIYVLELDADFKYKRHTVIGTAGSNLPLKLDFLEKMDDKYLIVASNNRDIVLTIENEKVKVEQGVMPNGYVKGIMADFTNHYVYDKSKGLIYFIYVKETDVSKAQLVSVSTKN